MNRVLVVDDKLENRYYLEALLGGHGYHVTCAADGEEALALARKDIPDVIISDLLMPVMDGYTLLRNWKADPRLQRVPFIVYTATYTEIEDERLALELGADAFILKPAEPEEFIARLDLVKTRPAAAPPPVASSERADETELLKHYSQTLIRKLEQRSLQLEEANRALQADLSQRQAMADALCLSEERFRLLARATNDAIWDWDIPGDTIWWGDGFASLFGHAPGTEPHNIAAWAALVHPHDREQVHDQLQSAIAGEGDSWTASYRLRRADGNWSQVEDRGQLLRDQAGTAIRMVGGLSDVSARVALEERIRSSQRLEAVGQLTGGIAHDFNNLLTVVLGNAEALSEQLVGDPLHHSLARMIVGAAERGADLTRRLLTFARRQALAPRAVDLNQLIQGIEPLLRRALGSNIEIDIQPHDGLPATLVDPGQLENALLNLCVNARDAMPTGGRITIATNIASNELSERGLDAPAQGQRYTLLSVSDTGSGIAPEHLDRVFEPFFSTKAEGEGTGLGLAMVYGFARQSGGEITVSSEPGQLTTFKLYLPLASGAAEPPREAGDEPALQRGSARILLVEDDPLVRQFAQAQLLALGYHVIPAQDGAQALSILDGGEVVDLLFTDIMMPGMSGRQLAQQAQQAYPGLKVLFTSGYPGEPSAADAPGRDPQGFDQPLLRKPYRRADLARRLREVLAESP